MTILLQSVIITILIWNTETLSAKLRDPRWRAVAYTTLLVGSIATGMNLLVLIKHHPPTQAVLLAAYTMLVAALVTKPTNYLPNTTAAQRLFSIATIGITGALTLLFVQSIDFMNDTAFSFLFIAPIIVTLSCIISAMIPKREVWLAHLPLLLSIGLYCISVVRYAIR